MKGLLMVVASSLLMAPLPLSSASFLMTPRLLSVRLGSVFKTGFLGCCITVAGTLFLLEN